MKKLLILGAGGYGKTVADVAAQLGNYDSIAFLDDRQTGGSILGTCGEFASLCDENTQVYPAFGSNEVRMNWLRILTQSGITVPTLIHSEPMSAPGRSSAWELWCCPWQW